MKVKRLLPRGLLARSLLIIVIPLVLLQVVSGIVFYERHWSNVSRHRANSLAGDIAMVIELMQALPGEQNTEWVVQKAARTMSLGISLAEADSVDFQAYRPTGFLETNLANSLRQMLRRPFVIDTDRIPDHVLVSLDLGNRVLHVSAHAERLISSTTKIFILWMMGTSLVLFGVATLFMRNQISPIRRLAKAADAFGKGRDVPNFRPAGAREVRQAAAAFLAMRDRLKRQIQQRTEMLAGVSHDLRTPLTRLKLQLAMLGESPEIAELSTDVADMERMVDGYLDFARGEGMETPQPTRVARLIEEVSRSARRNGIKVDLDVDRAIEMPVRRDAFKRCLTNLVDNATRYGTHIEVRARRNAKALQITIDDDGPGIPSEQREEAFRPFVRLDASRNPDTGGVGLGLTIARDIVRGHGGELRLSDSPHGGLRASIRLPL